jgi:RimJ/RimL family protein N-acetyltransferase
LGRGVVLDFIEPHHADALWDIIQQWRPYLGRFDPYFYGPETSSHEAIVQSIADSITARNAGLNLTAGLWQNERLIGRISCKFEPPSGSRRPFARLGYWIIPEYRGQNITPTAVFSLCQYILPRYNVHCAWLTCHRLNLASQRVARKAGFEVDYAPPQALRQPGLREANQLLFTRFHQR